MKQKIITIFGGTGFLGTHVVAKLAKHNFLLKIVTPNPDKGKHLLPFAPCGKIILMNGNIKNENSVAESIKNSNYVINLVGIKYNSFNNSFSDIHAKGAEYIAKQCAEQKLEKLIHISALGIDKPSGSLYARSKLNGETALLAAFPKATILRPSIIFGNNDNFFNFFAKMAEISPFLPLVGYGKTKFQPVYAGDIAQAIYNILSSNNFYGCIFELGGSRQYSFKELMIFLLSVIKKERILLPIPFGLSSLMASVLELMPNALLTKDQVRLLKEDNLVSGNFFGFNDLGINPASIENVVPTYLFAR